MGDLKKAYAAKTAKRQELSTHQDFTPESLAKKLGYYDIDYSDPQLEPSDVTEIISQRLLSLEKEMKKSQK